MINTILEWAGGIAIIGGAIAIIWKFISPAFKVAATVKNHTSFLNNDKVRIEKIESDIQAMRAKDAVIFQTLLFVLNHIIDGNGIEKIKETREDLQKLIKF